MTTTNNNKTFKRLVEAATSFAKIAKGLDEADANPEFLLGLGRAMVAIGDMAKPFVDDMGGNASGGEKRKRKSPNKAVVPKMVTVSGALLDMFPETFVGGRAYDLNKEVAKPVRDALKECMVKDEAGFHYYEVSKKPEIEKLLGEPKFTLKKDIKGYGPLNVVRYLSQYCTPVVVEG